MCVDRKTLYHPTKRQRSFTARRNVGPAAKLTCLWSLNNQELLRLLVMRPQAIATIKKNDAAGCIKTGGVVRHLPVPS